MILHPALIALLASSVLISLMVLYASCYGLSVLRKWDLKSGSELQLRLERRTYLISTLLAYALAFELVSLFLLIFTADDLCPLFVGAMCAAGALNVNPYGYPVLLIKVVVFLLAGLWLILNHTDNSAPDYPLIRVKYLLLLALTPLVLADFFVLCGYFLNLRADVITSCCGTLFSQAPLGALGQDISFLPAVSAKEAFYPSLALTFASGVYFYLKGRGGYFFSAFSAITLPVSIAAIISYISPYFYDLPTHRCPFCILQKEYGYVGYPIYITLLGGTVAGASVGALALFRRVPSLGDVLPRLMRRLTLVALVMYSVFAAIAAYGILSSDLVMTGY
jgi:hypothetical protein